MAEALAVLIAIGFCSISGRLRLCAAGDEGRKAIDRLALGRLHRRLRLRTMIALIAIAEVLLAGLLLLAREWLLLAWLKLWLGLRLMPRPESRLRAEVGIAIAVVAIVIERIAIDARYWLLLLRLVLAELLLRCRDQAEIVLSVLVVIFRRDRIAGAARITRKLNVFFCDVRCGAANLDVGSVGLENPGHRVLAAPVIIVIAAAVIVAAVIPVTHALVVILTVSHVSPLLPIQDCHRACCHKEIVVIKMLPDADGAMRVRIAMQASAASILP